MKIIRATIANLATTTKLFNAYRVFYNQPSDPQRAQKFIQERLKKRDSVIFLAIDQTNEAVGFAQIYPTFSSIRTSSIFTLNDLFIDPAHRNRNIARALLDAARKAAEDKGIAEIVLETAADNVRARKIYEAAGYKLTSSAEFLTYKLTLPAASTKYSEEKSIAPLALTRKTNGVVLITGVTSGLGREMVDRFHEKGWLVAGCGRSETAISKLRTHFGNAHYFEVVNIADPIAVKEWSNRVTQICGVPNLLINNASIINKLAKTEDVPVEEFAEVMDINVMGSVNVVQAFLPAMKERGTGTIINMSSGWGRTAEKELAPYCASKFAIEGFTKALAGELPKGMAAVALDPRDGIATPMLSICCPADYVKTAPSPTDWSHVAVPYMLTISSEQNGESLTCPPVVKPQVQEDKKKASAHAFDHRFWRKAVLIGGSATLAVSVFAKILKSRA